MKQAKHEGSEKDLSFMQVLSSIMWAFLGVQSNANRKRDFKHGKLSHFIIIGTIMGLLFVLIVYGSVEIILHLAGV